MFSNAPRHHGFTLIELLVVITIIVVLLALLTPALDRAIYQAELAVCGANQHAIGLGALIYTRDYKNLYPNIGPRQYWAGLVSDWHPTSPDLRPVIRGYITLKSFVDPLAGKIDLSEQMNPRGTSGISTDNGDAGLGAATWANYNWYFGWGYPNENKMNRVGQRFTWAGDMFNILAADQDLRHEGGGWTITGHPDSDSVGAFFSLQNKDSYWGGTPAGKHWTLSYWQNLSGVFRGTVDQNYLIDDGSVRRVNGVRIKEQDMALVPDYGDASDRQLRRVQLPRAN